MADASSLITHRAGTLESLTKRPRPRIGIDLLGQTDGLVNSYTTWDTIRGDVTVAVEHDTPFDDVEITFEGSSRASIERAGASGYAGRSSSSHTFLKLRQPMDETAYPHPRVFESGRVYKFPFTFVVPDQLLPQSCSHPKTNSHIQQAHTQLPPSLGDPMLSGDRVNLLDDMTPQMCQISYAIKVSISRRPLAEQGPARTLAAVAKKVRIIPAADEQPPLNVPDDSEDYCLRREKDVKKGLLRGKLGRLVMAASQPKPLQLSVPAKSDSTRPASTVATVHLRFDPVHDEQPPKLGTLWSKLKASTFYSTTAWRDFAARSPALAWSPDSGVYSETVPLSSRCIASVQWEKHTVGGDLSRRASMQSTSSAESIAGPSASYSGDFFYTASILVPITLPAEKTFVPTFHSCLVSRIYTLELCVSYHTPNATVLSPTCSLKVPVQVTCERSVPPAADHVAAHTDPHHLTDIDEEFFRPRRIIAPYTTGRDGSPNVVPSSPSSTSLSSSSSDAGDARQEPAEPPEYSNLAPLSGRPLGHRPDGCHHDFDENGCFCLFSAYLSMK
ncbi:hypothetical protein VTN02DRAFT_2346 [Thermoascus thermophilus]